MNDYRLDTQEKFKDFLVAGEKKDPNAEAWRLLRGHVRGPLPPDRNGLIAALHDRCVVTEAQINAWHELAKQVAADTKQTVYIVFTESRWHLMLFALPDKWYDDRWDGEKPYKPHAKGDEKNYANDQYIAHYDPDGTFKLDGAS